MPILNKKSIYKPLDTIEILVKIEGRLTLIDGEGEVYFCEDIKAPQTVETKIAGALGVHRLNFKVKEDGRIFKDKFRVDCRTNIEDNGIYKELFDMLYYTMIHFGEEQNALFNGKTYRFFVRWLRDHVHTLKGMKYFEPDIKTGIDLYTDTQREDGMIFDNIYPAESVNENYFNQIFGYGNFVKRSNDRKLDMRRIPVEADVEYLYVEGIYYTWKATGDDEWMKSKLDSAERAIKYITSDEYRWSKKYSLIKRGHTIDTWDFQHSDDAKITGHVMVVDKDKSHFGIMHGDNTGLFAACRYMAEMFEYSGNADKASKYKEFGNEIITRLNKLSFNGEFYTHHVPEDDFKRDVGNTDTDSQISMSNAYALNRGIPQEYKEKIIEKYLWIKDNLPEGAPAEFYAIYPIFENGYSNHSDHYEYMNGGVNFITGGELSHGAFQAGFEEYGADILKRIREISREYGDYLPCTLKGANPKPKAANYEKIDIKGLANISLKNNNDYKLIGWTDEGENDLRDHSVGEVEYNNIPFYVIKEEENEGKVAIGLKNKEGYTEKAEIEINKNPKSIYLLHAASGKNIMGSISIEYQDGEVVKKYMELNKQILTFWMPSDVERWKSHDDMLVLADKSSNPTCIRTQSCVYGFNNPLDKPIKKIILERGLDNNFWGVLGITLSDQPVIFENDKLSFGIPDNWAAAAVMYALVEGMAGVQDCGVGFNNIELSPRWICDNVNDVSVCVKYPASHTYTAYEYSVSDTIKISLAGNSKEVKFKALIGDRKISKVTLNNEEIDFVISNTGNSRYAEFSFKLSGLAEIEIY